MIVIIIIRVDVMVQHIVCEAKRQYNAFFELLNIPFIGADSQACANIADKGTGNFVTLKNKPLQGKNRTLIPSNIWLACWLCSLKLP